MLVVKQHGSLESQALASRQRLRQRVLTPVWLIVASVSLGACAHLGTTRHGPSATPEMRRAAIARAQVWTASDVAAKDLMVGPDGPGAFPPHATVTCAYRDKKMGGATPKFACVVPPDDELKVKYGRQNGEVYAEVAAARLFWALGFGAERMYPVRVVCQGCPPGILHETDVASVQRKMPGTDLETPHLTGWAWSELDRVDPTAGGAPRVQRDALKLLAAFIQHTDSKPEQQRLLCLPPQAGPKGDTTGDAAHDRQPEPRPVTKGEQDLGPRPTKRTEATHGDGACAEPFMLVHDLGKTFGHAQFFNRSSVASVNLQEWARAPVWQDPAQCIAYLPKSHTGSLEHPRISEAGRRFLASLLTQLSDAQLHDLFEAARFPQRWDPVAHPDHAATVEQWVDVFKTKRDAVVRQHCPEP